MVSDGHFEILVPKGRCRETTPWPSTPRPVRQQVRGVRRGQAPTAPAPKARRTIASLRGVIPTRYNIETELKAEVKPGGPNTYVFNLSK